jgi:hypothetical protein
MPFLGALSLIQKILGIAALSIILALSVALWAADRRADKWQGQALKCAEGRKADRAAYEQAQREAAAKNEAEVARIESEQEKITDDVSRDLNARLERLRSELRRNAPSKGSAGSPQAGAAGSAEPGANETARVCLAPEELLRAAENEERHDQLISWVERQLGVTR